MEQLIRYFVERPLVVHVIVAAALVAGYASATRAPRETFPNVTINRLIVTAVLPGASARDVETKVTIPLEEAIEELDGVRSYETVVTDSSSATEIELHPGFGESRIREAEQDLAVLIDAISDFPPEMEDEPVIQRLNPHKMPVVHVALSGPTAGVAEAARGLERRLRRLDEVSRVTLVGLQDPEVRVLVDPARAREHGVTLLDVVRAVERRNVSSTGGMLETAEDRRQVVLWSRYAAPEDVAETILRFRASGGALRIADVARIESGREDTGLLAHTNGEPGISVVVRKREDADIVDTVDAVRAAVAAHPLPEGVAAVLVKDESFMARNRLDLMFTNGILGAVLVTLVLFAFLTPHTAAWVLVGIPVVFLGSLALFPVFGFSINIVTLTAFVVVLGMVVDDAVVVAERIVARRQEGTPAVEASVQGALEMARPVTASAVTTMLAFLPLWALGGLPGKLIVALPAVVILALAVSLLESFFVLPGHMSMARHRGETGKRAFVLRMEARYRRLLIATLRHRTAVVLCFGTALVVILGALAPRLGVVLFPDDDSDALFIKVNTPLGTPLERTEAVVAALERQLPGILGGDLAAVTARIGHQETFADDRERGAAENEAVISALLHNLDRDRTSAEWIEVLERELVVPGSAELVFEVEPTGPPIGMPVQIHVASNEDDRRRGTALEMAAWLRGIDGIGNVEVDERPGTPQIELDVDYAKLALRGLDAEDVGRTLVAAFHGLVASEHRDLDETTDLRVLFDPSARRSLDALLEAPVRSRAGELVLLRDVVNPVEVPAVSRIFHRDGVRAAKVTASFAPGSPHTSLSMAQRLERELFPRYAGIPGLEIWAGGEVVETRETTAGVAVAALLAVMGIGVVIMLMLGSFLEAAFVLSIIPFAVAGVVLTFFLHGMPLSMFALLGSVGLAGVVVNASIVMVDAVHRRLAATESRDPAVRRDALIEAVVSRLRPVVVTTLTTLGGMLPTAYGIGGYDAVVSPMSLALGWGLALSTLVTLILIPTLYTLASDLRGFRLADLRSGRVSGEAVEIPAGGERAIGPTRI